MTDFACTFKQRTVSGAEHRIQLADMVTHIHGLMLKRIDFRQIKIAGNEIV